MVFGLLGNTVLLEVPLIYQILSDCLSLMSHKIYENNLYYHNFYGNFLKISCMVFYSEKVAKFWIEEHQESQKLLEKLIHEEEEKEKDGGSATLYVFLKIIG